MLPSRSSLFTEEGDSYTATVTPKAPSAFVPSGTATFREGPFTILGCEHVPVSAAAGSSGKAVCEAIPQEGTDQITAVYNGDSNFAPSESLPAAVTVSERNRAAEEATARKRTEEAAAKKRAEEEAAANSKKKAEEEAAATKRSEEQAASRLDAEITASLLSALTPGGKAARLAAVRKHGSCVVSFSAPSAGELVISWYELPKGAHLSSAKPVLVASGRATTSAAGGVKLTIKLTAMGKRLLKASRSLKLTAKGTFTPAGHAATSTTKQFMLH